ncbi:MAG: putative glycoside hydrolase [Treponema sp.]|jgi:hypothetical protein|nr:putative glycoside hydrolase [Treponema sp.]
MIFFNILSVRFRSLFFSLLVFVTYSLHAQNVQNDFRLVGTDLGLTGFDLTGKAVSFREAGGVRKITHAGGIWAILGSEGIFVSADLQNWEKRVQGLPVKSIKLFQNGKKSFLPIIQEVKDVKMNPANPDIMVCATKDSVYLSRNQGRSWSNIGAPPYRTNGIKTVAAANLPAPNGIDTLTVFMSHSVYGIYYIQPDVSGSKWTETVNGLEHLENTGNPDEVSDIAIVIRSGVTEIYASQTFRRRIYQLDWNRKVYHTVWSDSSPFGTVDSLDAGNSGIRFLTEGTVSEINYPANTGARAQMRLRNDLLTILQSSLTRVKPNCLAIRDKGRNSEIAIFNELWLINRNFSEFAKRAEDKEGLYLPVNHAMDSTSLRPYLNIISERKLNMVVIDMKDDYGRLRFTPRNQAIIDKGRVFRPLDIDALLKDLKSRGIFTVARIVVFKDPVLAAKEGGKYAVWDRRNNKPWRGYYDKEQPVNTGVPEGSSYETVIIPSSKPDKEILRTFYDENWVDPHSEEVWEYTANIAVELHERGFDEIQFDYIRFPTDGENLGDASYRWRENNMDIESAILSFLYHSRANVNAPISIDIYGANGWYRTGSRTGQEVELLAPWVDVICPMYYPSHFEQDFLAQSPPELRPWRIYYLGTLRTDRIARGQVVIRPWAQAFRLNVSYDRRYYGLDYVRLQVKGTRDAGKGGLTYWNNSGRYDDIPFPKDLE